MWRIEPCCEPERFFSLEKACFSNPWQANSFETSATQFGWITGDGKTDMAYLWIQSMAGEFEILRIATHLDFRKQGLGKQLLEWFLSQHFGVVHLEVECGNSAAIALYQSCGFKKTGERIDYYGPGKHATMMRREPEC